MQYQLLRGTNSSTRPWNQPPERKFEHTASPCSLRRNKLISVWVSRTLSQFAERGLSSSSFGGARLHSAILFFAGRGFGAPATVGQFAAASSGPTELVHLLPASEAQ